MKPYSYLVSALIVLLSCFNAFSQHQTELSPGYYIVVGAYAPARENVAQNYTEVLTRRGYNAGYGFNSAKNCFFVYLKYLSDLKASVQEMQLTRKQPEFAQAWVRVVPGEIHPISNSLPPLNKERLADEQRQKDQLAQQLKSETQKETPKSDVVAEDPKGEPAKKETSVTEASVIPKVDDGIIVTDNAPIVQFPKMTLGNTEVFLSLFDQKHNRIVEGTVTVMDAETKKALKEVKGNEYFYLPNPRSKSGKLNLVCDAFGYKKMTHSINFLSPLADTVHKSIELLGTTFVINFDLLRYGKDDSGVLGNVTFYNDAALMLPDSREELAGLLEMMRENPRYKIMLHGHTNGNYNGKIVKIGENKNFFSLEGAKSTMGTAKDLSYARAEVIKEYLIANGIDAGRMDVKGWGGKKPLFDKNSVNAKRNVRVEVQILSD
jgi:outer membrane protein OmpA-like peptidoglycan-associated protein